MQSVYQNRGDEESEGVCIEDRRRKGGNKKQRERQIENKKLI